MNSIQGKSRPVNKRSGKDRQRRRSFTVSSKFVFISSDLLLCQHVRSGGLEHRDIGIARVWGTLAAQCLYAVRTGCCSGSAVDGCQNTDPGGTGGLRHAGGRGAVLCLWRRRGRAGVLQCSRCPAGRSYGLLSAAVCARKAGCRDASGGCGRSGGAWKRGRQYSSCLCFMKSLPERKKSRDFQTKSRLFANITLSVPLWGAAPVPAAAKAARSAPAHFGAAFLRHTRASRHPPAQTRRHF